jgi:hypothetical protein
MCQYCDPPAAAIQFPSCQATAQFLGNGPVNTFQRQRNLVRNRRINIGLIIVMILVMVDNSAHFNGDDNTSCSSYNVLGGGYENHGDVRDYCCAFISDSGCRVKCRCDCG